VRNLPSEVEEEYLQLFFENKRKYGGGDIQHIELDCENRRAIVEFEDAECKIINYLEQNDCWRF
jgi:hypothetical protein